MASVWKYRWFHINFLVLGILLVRGTIGDLLSECNSRCSSSVAGSNSNQCDLSCRNSSCISGCSLWTNTTLSDCYSACNNTYSAEPYAVQYCQTGCLLAEDGYAEEVIGQIGDPSTPTVSEITNSSLLLMWTGAGNPAVQYLVEWRYSEGGGNAWNYYDSGQPFSVTSLRVTGLIPYASYQFRVVWVVTPRHTLTSNATNDIRTDPSGAPSTAPTITSVSSTSPNTISLAWDPPPFPNGLIQEYAIAVRSSPDQPAVVRTVGASVTKTNVIDSSFQPSTLYTAYVSARNQEGLGPSDAANITTAAAPNVTGIVPYLVVGVTSVDFNTIQEASIVSFVEFDQLSAVSPEQNDIHTVDNENSTIRDVAVHYWKNLVFISDSDGRIHRRAIDPANLTLAPSDVLYTNEAMPPTKLDVDWLNDKLFFVQGTEILRCDLNVSNCEASVTNIQSPPFEMKVDPYLGYLFWSVQDSGIYQASLSFLPLDAASASLLVDLPGTSAFTVNSESFRVFYTNTSGNTLHSISLDGVGETVRTLSAGDMHQFENTTSVTYFDQIFTWTHVGQETVESCYGLYDFTGGKELYYETDPNVISNSDLFLCVAGYHGLDVFHPSYQPIPMPSYPPTDLQALFTNSTADITWTRPTSIPGKGEGAWEEWLYEVMITDLGSGEATVLDGIQQVSVVADGLSSSTEYSIVVGAYSLGGQGPTSPTFSGSTLKEVAVTPFLLLANESRLWRTGLDGSSETNILIPPSTIRDIDWYQDYYIWSTTGNELYRSTDGSTAPTLLTIDPPGVGTSIEAIAVDWLSEFIYWADADKNQIIQGRLSDSSTVVTSPTVINPYAINVRDLAIDSVQSYLYWTTAGSVEASRLNGESPLVFYETGDFSQDVVAGLTLDLRDGHVYWFVLSRDGSQEELKLYRAEVAGSSSDPTSTTAEISVIMSATLSLDLHFYSSKLFWINRGSEVVVSDDRGQRQALLSVTDVQTLTVVQETLKPLPVGFNETPTVVAQEIPPPSIQVTGTWDDFNITWQASSEVTYGIVFYTLSVTAASGQVYESTLQDAYYNIHDLSPFQSLSVSVQPYTYWASTPPSTAQIDSPMSVPTLPLNPRAFILEDTNIATGDKAYSAEFRWSAPGEINGILLGYTIWWGTDEEQLTGVNVTAADVTFTYIFPSLAFNTTYYFQVEGFTEIGSGPSTSPVDATPGVSSPPPTILVSSGGVVSLTDVDTGAEVRLLGETTVSVVAYLASEEVAFYIETGDSEIYKSAFTDSTPQESSVVDPAANKPSSQASFVIDWITHILYWSDGAAIFSFDTTLSSDLASVVTVYSPPQSSTIGGIGISPYGSSLLWTEFSQSSSTLMTSDPDGQNAAPLFGANGMRRRRQLPENCTCSDALSPGSVLFVDSSDPLLPSLYLIDAATSDLWVSDLEGCQCQRLFEAVSQPNTGLPPDALSVDTSRVYWSNSAEGIVASVEKETGADFQSETGQNVDFVLTYGTSLQPYPAPECLASPDYDQSAMLGSSGSNSLILTFDPVPQCPDVTTATVVYTVHYAMVNETTDQNCSSSGLTCSQQMTSETTLTLGGLEPYTFYLTQVSAENLYSSGAPQLGPVSIHRTSPGVPSPAVDVVVSILTPSEAGVVWLSPAEVNGPIGDLQFRVLYSTESQDSRTLTGDTVAGDDGSYSVVIDDLTEATQYTFTVESYQASLPSNMYNSSAALVATSFQVPAQVQLVSSASTSLSVSWPAPDDNSATYHWIQYRENSEWAEALSGNTTSGLQYNVTIGEGTTDPLPPYTQYEVRAEVRYTSGRLYTYTGDEDILSARTDATAPDTIGAPFVIGIGTGTLQVKWEVPTANGPGDLVYTLDASGSSTGEWTEVYHGAETSWILVDLPTGDMYSFRVKGRNDFGEGAFSPASEPVLYPDPAADNTVFIIIGCVVGVLVVAAVIIVFLVCKHRRSEKWSTEGGFQEDVELARLRNYPDMQIREENSNYAVTHEGKEVLLPIFARERLKLITFLGSGAFGEVFEGNAQDILGPGSGGTRVAVKTLRKGAADAEKQEFLKEATVMGKFKHANIVSLMGVCLDNDPQYIILELMEGGDLLTYVRSARVPNSSKSKIFLLDQIEIIFDVAKGCEYLEELKFVHRDLAARNCLVSTKSYDAHLRVVKIGDFGLARDIYKNDYYRKEGEGLLPVRWMAPEGLMDGYFSVQSDVWAFGVLVWEVMSHGQQPYPARSNVEVLKFVESGGRLPQPEKCPGDMYQLMKLCWEKHPDDRPSFKMVREMVQEYRRKSGGPAGADNFGFEGDGKVNYSDVKNTPPEMQDYLLPMDSIDEIKKKNKPDIELPPDIDYDEADKEWEDDLKKKTRGKGSKKGGKSSLRGRKGDGDGQPRLEAALQDLAHKKGRDVDDDRYLKYPVGSVSKATGAEMAAQSQPSNNNSLKVPGVTTESSDPDSLEGAVGYSDGAVGFSDSGKGYSNGAVGYSDSAAGAKEYSGGAVGYTDSSVANGDAPNSTDLANYMQPKKRHPNPFRANSMEELEGYDNLAFAKRGDIKATDYADV